VEGSANVNDIVLLGILDFDSLVVEAANEVVGRSSIVERPEVDGPACVEGPALWERIFLVFEGA
jgi:hypothetical protein